jgi:hypothetical protein
VNLFSGHWTALSRYWSQKPALSDSAAGKGCKTVMLNAALLVLASFSTVFTNVNGGPKFPKIGGVKFPTLSVTVPASPP